MKKLVIIGFGLMGSVFARELQKLRLFDISVYIRKKGKIKQLSKKYKYHFVNSLNICKDADVIILAIPFSAIKDIANSIKNILKKDVILFDLCSIKEEPMKITKKLKCETFGVHPLFGYVENFKGYKIVICPRNKKQEKSKSLLYIKNILKKTGAEVIVIDAKKHDKIVGKIQGITHFIGLNLAEFIKKNDEEELRKFSTPTFEYLLKLVDRMKLNNRDVFLSIQKENKYAIKARKDFLEYLRNFCKKIEK